MAAKGSCVSNVLYHGDIVGYKWTLTADASGDADENASGDKEWFLGPIYGTVVAVEVEWTDAEANYDLYVKDGNGIDILKGLGVNLAASASDAKNRFCPLNTSQELVATSGVYGGMPIYLWNATLEAIGDEMGNGKISAITVFVRQDVMIPNR